jgi:putative ABC transport system substrate-binding protein
MNRLRRRLLAAAPALLAGRVLAQPAAARRIAVISLAPRSSDPRLAEFERALGALGYVDGKNVEIDWLYSDDRPERLPGMINEILQNHVSVIVATSTTALEALRKRTATVPIVFITSVDPVASGFAQSLARPGFNMTGMAPSTENVAPRQLELLRQAVPGATRIGVLLNPRNRQVAQARRRYEEAAAKLGVELIVIQAGTGESLSGTVGAARSRGAQALVIQADNIFFQHRAALVEALAAQKLPAIFSQRESVEAGGLMSYGPNETESYRRAASYVERLLKGARASELAIERPAKIELAVNPKTAAALGLLLPGSLLHSADRIVR